MLPDDPRVAFFVVLLFPDRNSALIRSMPNGTHQMPSARAMKKQRQQPRPDRRQACPPDERALHRATPISVSSLLHLCHQSLPHLDYMRSISQRLHSSSVRVITHRPIKTRDRTGVRRVTAARMVEHRSDAGNGNQLPHSQVESVRSHRRSSADNRKLHRQELTASRTLETPSPKLGI